MIQIIALARRFWLPLTIFVAFVALYIGLQLYVRDAVQDDRAQANQAALEVGKKADDTAGQVAASTAATIQQETEDARQAAARSDDPLADGLRSLRANKNRKDQAAR
ncbi:hypothetical protein [Novosphingobium olei]|uniref:hypothetical protein n=1 Tax=Novosphingobium olei TaxID=2728851 RepID=UPI003089878B|nr:hypothetical protein NSDW_11510 [Novosphingobium olei]